MRVYVCFDDTDVLDAPRGTGKLARWFADELPADCYMLGVVRQQLLVDDRIPYTSHNSSACTVIDVPEASFVAALIERGAMHLERHALEGSDPGLCVVAEDSPSLAALMEFGKRASVEIVTQADAVAATEDAHLSGHGGTNDGIIGAAAGVGLTAWGWSGRFIEFGALREYPMEVEVGRLMADGMLVLPVDRNVVSPKPEDVIDTAGWLRPRLWGGKPCVPVMLESPGRWLAIGKQPDAKAAEGTDV
jgi:hypothetical protein